MTPTAVLLLVVIALLAVGLVLLNQRLEGLSRNLLESQKTVGDRLDTASRLVGDVQRGLGELGEANRRLFEVGKDIAGLQDLLRAPKPRGGLGEYLLGELLGQVLPAAHFTLQHAFKSGDTVDAALRLGGRIVPVDAKFPLENFRRLSGAGDDDARRAAARSFRADVKKHVDAIAGKYILPDEGTFDFALMYIPAENVYYEMIVRDEESGGILPYALSRRVVPVSPGSFYAYLQALALGLRGLQIEDNARCIMDNLARLQGDFRRFTDEFDLLGRHLGNARTKYEDAAKRLDRLGEKLTGSVDADQTSLEGPVRHL
jgi:DNA recombination protein RmuC